VIAAFAAGPHDALLGCWAQNVAVADAEKAMPDAVTKGNDMIVQGSASGSPAQIDPLPDPQHSAPVDASPVPAPAAPVAPVASVASPEGREAQDTITTGASSDSPIAPSEASSPILIQVKTDLNEGGAGSRDGGANGLSDMETMMAQTVMMMAARAEIQAQMQAQAGLALDADGDGDGDGGDGVLADAAEMQHTRTVLLHPGADGTMHVHVQDSVQPSSPGDDEAPVVVTTLATEGSAAHAAGSEAVGAVRGARHHPNRVGSGSVHAHQHPPSPWAPFVLIILLFSLAGAQAGLVYWKKHYYRSYQNVTLFLLWLLPAGVCLYLSFYRFLSCWTLFTGTTMYLIFLATRRPLPRQSPRRVYKYFSFLNYLFNAMSIAGYVLVMFTFGGNIQFGALGLLWLCYGLYFGVLARDCAEMCADRMAQGLGYQSNKDHGLSTRHLPANHCAICDSQLLVTIRVGYSTLCGGPWLCDRA